ncbi:MAG: YdcF family protein [Magnetococcales bacterium]|nr:YdcF family protein [Magnetococcales bacterium]MBF0321687.1 YdcF family protein [Magnetococcales bacterium]
MPHKPAPWLLVSLSGNLLFLLIFLTPLTEFLAKPLIVDEPLRQAEVAVVFASGWVNETVLDYDTLLRMQRGLELYRSGWVRKIICLGGTRLPHPEKPYIGIAEGMRKVAILWGVPPSDVVAEADTTNTYDDLHAMVAKLGHAFNFNNAIYVSSAYHSARIRWFLNSMGVTGAVTHAYPVELSPLHFTQRFQIFQSIAREYLVHAYYRLMPSSPLSIFSSHPESKATMAPAPDNKPESMRSAP